MTPKADHLTKQAMRTRNASFPTRADARSHSPKVRAALTEGSCVVQEQQLSQVFSSKSTHTASSAPTPPDRKACYRLQGIGLAGRCDA